MIKRKNNLTILISILILISCTPQRRLNNLLDRHPHLKVNTLDTLILHDSVIVENYRIDTTRLIEYHDSTIIINNEKVIAKYIFDTITNEIHHIIECKGDTIRIIKEIPFEVEKIKYVKENRPYKNYLNIGIIIVFLLIALALMKNIREIFF